MDMIFTLLRIYLIDKLGRKQLMYIGSIISLSLVSLAFIFNWEGSYMPLFLFAFIAAHAIGQGTVIWVFISEISPNHLRGFGQSFGCSVHWVLAAVVPSLVPVLFTMIGAGAVFAFFAFMMVFQLLFVVFMMPETKGKTLEELQEVMLNKWVRKYKDILNLRNYIKKKIFINNLTVNVFVYCLLSLFYRLVNMNLYLVSFDYL